MTSVRALDETGVPSDAKEAVSFAQQGLEAVLGRAALVPIYSDSLITEHDLRQSCAGTAMQGDYEGCNSLRRG